MYFSSVYTVYLRLSPGPAGRTLRRCAVPVAGAQRARRRRRRQARARVERAALRRGGAWRAGLVGALVVALGLVRSAWGGRLRLSGPWLASLAGLMAVTTWALAQRPVLENQGVLVTMAERALSTRP